MKPIKTLLCAALLCIAGAVSLNAQQHRLNASPNYPYFLDNIYDLRNGTTAVPNPVGLVQFIPAAAAGTMGTSIERYNPANGAVLTPTFNYIPSPGTPFANLRGTKFTEAFGSYFTSGTVMFGGLERIFLLRTSTTTGAVTTSRYLTLPANALRPVVSNIIVESDIATYVSGTVTYNNRLCVFAFRTNMAFTAVNWFRIYPLSNRDFNTFAQCLVRDGNNGLVIGGVDQTNNRAVVLKANPATGALLAAPNAFSLCLNAANCMKINRVSLGLSGGAAPVRNLVVQTTAAPVVLFNVSQMNAAWTLPLTGTTYQSPNWDLKSVRFEPAGVLLSHLETTPVAANSWYNRSRYNPTTGTLLPGTAGRYQPPTLDLTGIASSARQVETISLTFFNNRVFSVGKYRYAPTNNTRTLAELQPSQPQCQVALLLAASPEKLFQRAETLTPVAVVPGNITLPTTRIDLFVTPVQVCAAANLPDGNGDVNGRSEEAEEAQRNAAQTGLLSAFPNPFAESLTVTLADGGVTEAMLLDMTGKVVGQWQFGGTEPTETLLVPGLTSGIYLLRVRDDRNQWHYRKMLKE